jgi:hypothetical protein
MLGLPPDSGGEGFERFAHAFAVGALHDHDDVLIIAELANVLLPPLLVVFIRVDEIVTPGVIFEAGIECARGNRGQEERGCEHQAGVAAHTAD